MTILFDTLSFETTPGSYFEDLEKLPKVYEDLKPPVNPGPPQCALCNDHGGRHYWKFHPKDPNIEVDAGFEACPCKITRDINQKMARILANAPRGQTPTHTPFTNALLNRLPGLVLRGEWDVIASHLWVLFEVSMRRLGTSKVTIRTLTDYEAFNIRVGQHEAKHMSKEERESGAYINTIQDYVGADHALVLLRTGFYSTNSFSTKALDDVVSARIAIRKPLWIIERHDRTIPEVYGQGVLDQLETQGFRIVTFDSPSDIGIALDDDLPVQARRPTSRSRPASARHETEPTPTARSGLDLTITEPSNRSNRRSRSHA